MMRRVAMTSWLLCPKASSLNRSQHLCLGIVTSTLAALLGALPTTLFCAELGESDDLN